MKTFRNIALLAVLGAAFLSSCRGRQRVEVPETSGNAAYAQYFDLLSEGEGWAIVSVSPYDGSTDTLRVAEPLQKIVCMSTSHVGFLDAIGAADAVAAVSGLAFVSSPAMRERIAEGRVAEAGYDAAPAYETLVQLRPDVVLSYSLGGDTEMDGRLRALGLRVFTLYEHLETHPLARAEYVRLFGALTGRMAVADSLFPVVSSNYLSLAIPLSSELPEFEDGLTKSDRASSERPQNEDGGAVLDTASSNKPVFEDGPQKVLVNLPYAGVWYIPGAESYMARLIRDAGGEVLGAEPGTSQSGMISLEKAYQYACEADWWLNAGNVRSMEELISESAVFTEFPVARPGRVYTNNRRQSPGGGNDFWESGAVRPDLILKDLRTIFAGGPEDSLYYYRAVR